MSRRSDPTPLPDLERQLLAAGRRLDAQAAPGRRRWRPWTGSLTILAAVGLTTGALAATGNLPILQVGDHNANPNYQVMGSPGFDTKAKAKPTILPMRVVDPQGGPSWALRTFPIGRGTVCAQAGQLYQGKFGLVTQIVDRVAAPSASGPAPAKTVFQVLAPSAAISGVRCGAARSGGQLVAEDRTPIVIYPDGTDLRCRNSPPSLDAKPCRITAVKVVRWGFLGPQAKTATFVRPGGRRGPTEQLEPATGGAYLFAESLDPKPFRDSQAFERAVTARVARRFPALRTRAGHALTLRTRMAEVQAFMRAVAADARPQRQANWRAQQAEAVDATFSGTAARRVAGPGAKGGPLPGVAPVTTSIPKVGPAAVSVRFRGLQRAVEVRFSSPVALDDHPGLYALSVRGPQNGTCGKAHSTQAQYAKETAAGAPILVRIRPVWAVPGHRFGSWCPGGRYDVRVRYIVYNPGRPGLRSDQPVGTAQFTAR